MRHFKATVLATVCGALMTSLGAAQIAYNSFGAGDSYDIYWNGIGSGVGGGVAMNFDSATTGYISKVRMALGPNFLYDVSVNLDDNGLPGTAIETWTGVSGAGLVDVFGDGSAYLQKGGSYWVVLLGEANQSGVGEWAVSGSGAMGHWAEQAGTAQWYGENGEVSAYRVETTPVPEPASAAVLASGALAVAARRRKKTPR